jgi:cytochrome c
VIRNWLWLMGVLSAGVATAAPVPVGSVADKQHGEVVFRACGGCHHERADATGPDLHGVVGRKAGSLDGFRYSNAMKRANLVWTVENLRAYLRDPQAVVKGNRMPFPGLPADTDVDDVVAFLESFK